MRSLSGASAFMDARPVESDEGGIYNTANSATNSSRFLTGGVASSGDATTPNNTITTTTSATSPPITNRHGSASGSFPPLGPIRTMIPHPSNSIATPAYGIFATAASGTSLTTLMHYPPSAAVIATTTPSTIITATTPTSTKPPTATKGMTGLSKILSVGDLLDEYDDNHHHHENNNSPTHHQFQQDLGSSSAASSPSTSGHLQSSDEGDDSQEDEEDDGGDHPLPLGASGGDNNSGDATTTHAAAANGIVEEEEIVTTVGQEIVYSALLNASDFGLLQPENPDVDNEHLFPLRPAQTFDPAIRRAYSLMNLRGIMLGSFSPEHLRWEPFEYHDLSSEDEEEDMMTTNDHSPENTPGATRTSSVVNPNLSVSSRNGAGGGTSSNLREPTPSIRRTLCGRCRS